MTAYERFCQHAAEINDILCALNLLQWDARTQMPPEGAITRGRQLATLTRLAQERFTSAENGRLIERAEAELAGADPDSYPVRAVKAAREAYDIFQRIPADLMAERAALSAEAQNVWVEARKSNNYALFAPYLRQMVAYAQQVAEAIGYSAHPYDALLVQYEPGMTAQRLSVLFAELRAVILPLLQRITASAPGGAPQLAPSFFQHDFPIDQQRAFAIEAALAFGYDLNRGRVDIAPHPFEISFTRQDVRITTRYQLRYPFAAIFGLMHETGHGLYEQGADPALTRSALTSDYLGFYAAAGASFGMHEGQSRLWENLIGRSMAFWRVYYPRLQEYFPTQLADVSLDTFYRAANRVRPSLIRVEADEVTYNLHIMLRTEIEMGLLDGAYTVDELPAVWNAKMEEYLGLTPPDDAQGVLQDLHWATGYFGSFPTYTLGNVISGQLMAAARKQVSGLDDALTRGEYAPLHNWLSDNIYRHARAYAPDELLVRATGQPLNTGPYLAYISEKYEALYPA